MAYLLPLPQGSSTSSKLRWDSVFGSSTRGSSLWFLLLKVQMLASMCVLRR